MCVALSRSIPGTPYDLSSGLASGPFGDPDRIDTHTAVGSWERSLALYRTTYVSVAQARGWLPDDVGGVVWYALAQPSTSTFVPLTVGVTAVHPWLATGSPFTVDRGTGYWACRQVYNDAHVKYGVLMPVVAAAQAALEAAGDKAVLVVSGDPAANATAVFWANVEGVVSGVAALSDALLGTWYDVGGQYPAWWLHAVGYDNGPAPLPPR